MIDLKEDQMDLSPINDQLINDSSPSENILLTVSLYLNELENNENEEIMKKLGLPSSFKSKNDFTSEKVCRKKELQERRQRKKKFSRKRIIESFKLRKFHLFSKFSEFDKFQIKIDDDIYPSITSESLAKKIAVYCQQKVDYTILIDGFSGVAGNLVQFAVNNKNAFIIGIELNFDRIETAKKICKVYEIENQCDFICGDFLKVAPALNIKPDIIFLSPPWGLRYKKKKKIKLENLPINGMKIFEISKRLTKNIFYYLPQNQCIDSLNRLGEDYSLGYNSKDNFGATLNVYFGDLIDEVTVKSSSKNSSLNSATSTQNSGFLDCSLDFNFNNDSIIDFHSNEDFHKPVFNQEDNDEIRKNDENKFTLNDMEGTKPLIHQNVEKNCILM